MTMKPSFLRLHSLFAGGAAIELGADRLVIRLPDPRLLRLIARYLLLAIVIVSLPWLLHVSSPAVVTNDSKAEYTPTLIGRRLLSVPEAKKEALNGLEDALLEPPVRSHKKPWRRTRYLPELIGDKLEKYPRRVFVDVIPSGEEAGGAAAWFQRHYPKKKSAFDIIQLVVQEAPEQSLPLQTSSTSYSTMSQQPSAAVGLGGWLERNVKEEEYVVVKAEAEAVEEVVESGAVRLVDELFLECKHQWGKGTERSRRAYWQCLALYGKLRDEGVAVHQWWGA